MKRKRKHEQTDDPEICDLILTDVNGRSIRVHKALLIDKSDYFARILTESNPKELQLNESYLIDLIQYLYSHESCGQGRSPNTRYIDVDSSDDGSNPDSSVVTNGDTEILMQLLVLSKKYGFRQLYGRLMAEINHKLGPSSVLTVYKCATEMGIDELHSTTIMMILSWLPQLQNSEAFFSLSEESINNIFSSEAAEVDNECKLNALSAWWSHNKEADMTNLWAKLITCANK